MEVLLPANQDPVAISVLMHGLNNPPKFMLPLAKRMNTKGIAVVNGVLTGHDGDMSVIQQATKETWLKDTMQAIEKAHELAKGKLPVFYVGFSLGGMMGVYASSLYDGLFHKALLLAPALAFKPIAYWAQPLLPLLSPFSIFSLAPAKYSVNRWIPINAYRILFEMHDSLHTSEFQAVRGKAPVKIIMRSDDELIYYRGIQEAIRNYQLDDWELIAFPRKTKIIQHVVADVAALGKENLQLLDSTMDDFFLGD